MLIVVFILQVIYLLLGSERSCCPCQVQGFEFGHGRNVSRLIFAFVVRVLRLGSAAFGGVEIADLIVAEFGPAHSSNPLA